MRLTSVELLPDGAAVAESLPMRDVRLWPGQSRRVVLRVLFSDCEGIGARSSSLLSSVELTMRGGRGAAAPGRAAAGDPADGLAPRGRLPAGDGRLAAAGLSLGLVRRGQAGGATSHSAS